MYEYHGWITVRASPAGDDEAEDRLPGIVDGLRLHIAAMADPYLLDLRWMNGEPFIHLGGHSNHSSPTDVLGLFTRVAAVAPGSYGLLHIRDDEDPEHGDEVRVVRLARGLVTHHTESLLSPCVPTLEDPFTGPAAR
ncbi:Imm7 family immunity protein [Streptomyces liangshanensis]|uniref:Imm7 family immunity protein n=1 Tax=Streptomyces liangshanensis TaxID=2717324 RepID=UPI0036DF0367